MPMNALFPSPKQRRVSLHRVEKWSGRKREQKGGLEDVWRGDECKWRRQKEKSRNKWRYERWIEKVEKVGDRGRAFWKKIKAGMFFFRYAAEMFEIYSVCHQLLKNNISHVI